MRFVAGVIETLPQTVVRCAALIGLLPLLTQGTQGLLHLAPADRLTLRSLEQGFGLLHQLFAQLIGTPALPAFEFPRRGQRRVCLILQLVVNDPSVLLQGMAQGRCRSCTGFAVSLRYFLFKLGQRVRHRRHRLRLDFRVDRSTLGPRRCLHRHASGSAQFFGPDRHRRQGRSTIYRSSAGLRQRVPESFPDHQQLTP